jgi:glycerol uptake facilitator protein
VFGAVPLGVFADLLPAVSLVGTIMILVLIEHRNSFAPNQNMFPMILGVGVFAVVALTPPLSITSLNGAHDLGPRVVAYFLGWGKMALLGLRGDFWIPTVAPILGGILGGFVYFKTIQHLYPGITNQQDTKQSVSV